MKQVTGVRGPVSAGSSSNDALRDTLRGDEGRTLEAANMETTFENVILNLGLDSRGGSSRFSFSLSSRGLHTNSAEITRRDLG